MVCEICGEEQPMPLDAQDEAALLQREHEQKRQQQIEQCQQLVRRMIARARSVSLSLAVNAWCCQVAQKQRVLAAGLQMRGRGHRRMAVQALACWVLFAREERLKRRAELVRFTCEACSSPNEVDSQLPMTCQVCGHVPSSANRADGELEEFKPRHEDAGARGPQAPPPRLHDSEAASLMPPQPPPLAERAEADANPRFAQDARGEAVSARDRRAQIRLGAAPRQIRAADDEKSAAPDVTESNGSAAAARGAETLPNLAGAGSISGLTVLSPEARVELEQALAARDATIAALGEQLRSVLNQEEEHRYQQQQQQQRSAAEAQAERAADLAARCEKEEAANAALKLEIAALTSQAEAARVERTTEVQELRALVAQASLKARAFQEKSADLVCQVEAAEAAAAAARAEVARVAEARVEAAPAEQETGTDAREDRGGAPLSPSVEAEPAARARRVLLSRSRAPVPSEGSASSAAAPEAPPYDRGGLWVLRKWGVCALPVGVLLLLLVAAFSVQWQRGPPAADTVGTQSGSSVRRISAPEQASLVSCEKYAECSRALEECRLGAVWRATDGVSDLQPSRDSQLSAELAACERQVTLLSDVVEEKEKALLHLKEENARASTRAAAGREIGAVEEEPYGRLQGLAAAQELEELEQKVLDVQLRLQEKDTELVRKDEEILRLGALLATGSTLSFARADPSQTSADEAEPGAEFQLQDDDHTPATEMREPRCRGWYCPRLVRASGGLLYGVLEASAARNLATVTAPVSSEVAHERMEHFKKSSRDPRVWANFL